MANRKNFTCRIHGEYIDFLEQLPEIERFEIFYKVVLSAIDENDSITVSDSMSDIGKSAYNLLKKNIKCKIVSENYGGKRPNAGRKPSVSKKETVEPEIVKPENQFVSMTTDLTIRAELANPESAVSIFLENGSRYDELTVAEREFVDRADVRAKCVWHKELQAAAKQVKRKVFTPPTMDEWLDFCREKNLDLGKMRNAYESYVVADWHDSQGNPIRNWKQKILQVWAAKPQNYNQQTASFGARPELNKVATGAEMAKRMLKEQGIIQ